MSEELNLQLRYEWLSVETDAGTPYAFPGSLSSEMRSQLATPAIYRWVLYRDQPGDLRTLYVGETEHLARRLYHYLKPGPSQQTNLRINAHFLREIQSGRSVCLDVLRFEPFYIGAQEVAMPSLQNNMIRRFLEHLIAFQYVADGYTVLNL